MKPVESSPEGPLKKTLVGAAFQGATAISFGTPTW
jgi:hypothetical protein